MKKILLLVLLSLFLTACSTTKVEPTPYTTVVNEDVVEDSSIEYITEESTEPSTELSVLSENILVKDINYYNENKNLFKIPTEKIRITLDLDSMLIDYYMVDENDFYVNCLIDSNSIQLWGTENDDYIVSDINDVVIAYQFELDNTTMASIRELLSISNVVINDLKDLDTKVDLSCDFVVGQENYKGNIVLEKNTDKLLYIKGLNENSNIDITFNNITDTVAIPQNIEFTNVDDESVYSLVLDFIKGIEEVSIPENYLATELEVLVESKDIFEIIKTDLGTYFKFYNLVDTSNENEYKGNFTVLYETKSELDEIVYIIQQNAKDVFVKDTIIAGVVLKDLDILLIDTVIKEVCQINDITYRGYSTLNEYTTIEISFDNTAKLDLFKQGLKDNGIAVVE